jgi:hypothetical protein
MKNALVGILVIYIFIGFINSMYLWATVGISSCAAASGILNFYCNSGKGISHFVAIAGWPFFWL